MTWQGKKNDYFTFDYFTLEAIWTHSKGLINYFIKQIKMVTKLEELDAWIRELFSSMKNKNYAKRCRDNSDKKRPMNQTGSSQFLASSLKTYIKVSNIHQDLVQNKSLQLFI